MPNSVLKYKELIYKELDNMPSGTYPKLYDIIKNLSKELNSKKGKKQKTKLKGLWGKIEIDEDLINEAKHSLFINKEF